MKRLAVAAALSISVMTVTGAQAAGITFETFSSAKFAALTAGTYVTTEDFEENLHGSASFVSGSEGELTGPLVTDVGTFSALGGTGDGGTCQANSTTSPCSQIALEDDEILGQGNLVPDDGTWSLSNNGTLGIRWLASRAGDLFNTVIFAIKDAADQPSILLKVEAGGMSGTFGPSFNGNEQIVVVKFASKVASATIDIFNTSDEPDDSFTIDGATVSMVPLPASALFLLGGVGVLGAIRRRNRKT